MQPAQMAYDRAITVFSPDGRLFQVEYAREAVKRGTTTVGLKYKDGVVLIIDKKIRTNLIEQETIEKIFKIDNHIGVATSGLVADARVLVNTARQYSQLERVYYEEPILVEYLVKQICDLKQQYTQYSGVRPFGISLLIAGVDKKGVHLYETDPSGAMLGYKADSIGAGRETVMEIFEDKYKDNMSMSEVINLGLEALITANEDSINPDTIEIAVVSKKEDFHKLSSKDIKKYITKAQKGKSNE